MSKEEYSWSKNADDEIWTNGIFDSIEECIKDAVESGVKPGEKIAVGICERYTPHVDVGTLLDRAAEDAYEECGEVAEDWPEFISRTGYKDEDKLQEEMNKVFIKWLKETGQYPSFYHILPLAEPVIIPEEG